MAARTVKLRDWTEEDRRPERRGWAIEELDRAAREWFFGHVVRPRWRVLLGMVFLSLLAGCLGQEIVVSPDFDEHPGELARIKIAGDEWNRETNGYAGVVFRTRWRGDPTGFRVIYRSPGAPPSFEGRTDTHKFVVRTSVSTTLYVGAIDADQAAEDASAAEELRPPADYFYRAILHELGHELGIISGYGDDGQGHTRTRGSAMFATMDGAGDCVGPADVALFDEANNALARPHPCEAPVLPPRDGRQEQLQ